jgi:DNA-directed RNA polymerase specialized sigma24 family protein
MKCGPPGLAVPGAWRSRSPCLGWYGHPVGSEPSTPSASLVAIQLSKPDMGYRLRRIAMWSARAEADAEDLVNEALARVIDPKGSPWDPAKRTFLTHMAFVMKYVWGHDRRKARIRREIVDDDLARDPDRPDGQPRADDELERARSLFVLQQLGKRLQADQAEDPLAAQVFDVGVEHGVHEPEELAQFLPNKVDEIKAALKRLKYRARQILDEWNASEERRMKELREAWAETKGEAAP